MGISDYSETDAGNATVPGSPPIELGEGIGGGPTGHQNLRRAIQRIMADLKTFNEGLDLGGPGGPTGVDTSGTPVANDFARFTDEDTIEGRSYAEVREDLGLEIGTDVQAYDVDTAKTDVAQTFTALQVSSVEAMVDGATITPTGTKHLHTVTLGGNRTLANPTSITTGATYVFKFTQDGTGSRTLAWGAAYDWAGGTAPVLSTGTNDVDVFSGISFDGTTIQMVTVGQDFS